MAITIGRSRTFSPCWLVELKRGKSEGLLISHLVRIAMASIAVAPTWELLQATNLTEAQLATVQKGWEEDELAGGRH